MTKKKLREVETKLRTAIETALETGWCLRREEDDVSGGRYAYNLLLRDELRTCCLLGSVAESRLGAQELLELDLFEVKSLEAGFEGWNKIHDVSFNTPELKPQPELKALGLKLYKEYCES